MRVLLISHTCQSPTEGQPKAVQLSRIDGVELMVVVPDRWKHYGRWRPLEISEDARNVIHPTKVRWPWLGPAQFYLHWYPRLKSIVRSFRPDVIDVWEEPWGLVSLQAARLRDRYAPQAKLVLETEQNLNKQLPMPFEWIRRKSLSSADWLVARNPEAVEVCRAKGYAGPANVLPNAVDADLFVPMDRHEARESLGLCGRVIGYIGRLVPEKGLVGLLESLVRLPEDVSLLLVGQGPMEAELRTKAEELGLSERLHLLGHKPLSQLPTVMNALDALMLPSLTTPSWKEQFGRVIIEAFACGTAVVGSDSGAIPHVIGDDGWVFREGDIDDMARVLSQCLEVNQADQREAQQRRRERVLNEFTWAVVARRYMQVYQSALASGAKPDEKSTAELGEAIECH